MTVPWYIREQPIATTVSAPMVPRVQASSRSPIPRRYFVSAVSFWNCRLNLVACSEARPPRWVLRRIAGGYKSARALELPLVFPWLLARQLPLRLLGAWSL
jgi:hypothetical protein